MATKEIKLYYALTRDRILPPGPGELDRKEKWIEAMQMNLEDGEVQDIEVAYKKSNRKVRAQKRFFEGPVVEYWTIQATEKELTPELRRLGRTTLLDKTLGYDVPTLTGKIRERESTTNFVETQQWHDFLKTIQETEFEPNGYEYPDSDHFNRLKSIHGYSKAKKIIAEELINRINKKLSTRQEDN